MSRDLANTDLIAHRKALEAFDQVRADLAAAQPEDLMHRGCRPVTVAGDCR